MSKTSKIRKGDLVRLNSGSPKLTVSSVLNDRAIVIWYDIGRDQMNEATFSSACLTKIQSKGKKCQS